MEKDDGRYRKRRCPYCRPKGAGHDSAEIDGWSQSPYPCMACEGTGKQHEEHDDAVPKSIASMKSWVAG